jgi:diadenosine tetraphosphatase ApaH/serine/threonine PP2A family protein phosphatase
MMRVRSLTLANVSRVIVVGDLHGCYDEAIELLDKCNVTEDDTIIFTGDLVDRGPKPVECVELAMKHMCVMGNHEQKHLLYRSSKRQLDTMPPHHAHTHSLLTETHWSWIERLPTYIRIPEHNLIVVHAGLWPGVPIEKQDTMHLLHLQCVNEGPTKKSSWPSKSKQGTFWTNHYNGPERVVFGHTGLNKPLQAEYVTGVDTGCVFGRQLTAYVSPNNEFVQVNAHSQHYGRKVHPVLGQTDWSTLIPIHGDVCTYS